MQREIDMIVRQLLLKSVLFKWISKLFHVTKDIRKSRFEFYTANVIFSQEGNFQVFKKSNFRGVMSKIQFEQNWRYGCVLYYGF